jgi:predicted ATPase/class 3 adenylate cyclase
MRLCEVWSECGLSALALSALLRAPRVSAERLGPSLCLELPDQLPALVARQLCELVERMGLVDMTAVVGIDAIEDRRQSAHVAAFPDRLHAVLGHRLGILLKQHSEGGYGAVSTPCTPREGVPFARARAGVPGARSSRSSFPARPIGAIVTSGMVEAPKGTVSFVFTDIEGSTKLLHALGRDRYGEMLGKHQRLLRAVWSAYGGYEVDTEGDAFFVAFAQPSAALVGAAAGQRALTLNDWPKGFELCVRMGVHSGEASMQGGKYVGVAVHRAARICAAAHGGQILVSQTTADLCADEELDAISLRDLGLHRLKDLTEPQRLYQLVGEALAGEFPSLRTLENRPTNLPIQPTALIGRQKELKELDGLLKRDTVRLVTLTGPGGTGKTRLALQLAAELIEQFSSGVFFVSLAPISDPDLLIPAVAQTLGVREQSGVPLLETLGNHLREKQTLLLLDNFEQISAAAPMVAALLASAPELQVLATSRTPLHLSGEQTYDVPPLALPDVVHLPGVDALTQYEAVALFIERARSAKSGFTVTNENAPAVAEICVRLDGLPLALELAAARVRVLPPQTLLSRLDHRLKLLTGGALDLDERQRTLRATIDWSYDLLSEREQRLFSRLGVFAGGCRLEAAEAVCDHEIDGQDILDGLTSLVEKNLLRQKEDPDGEPRFWMLETIREFAEERLDESAEARAVHRLHGEHFLHIGEEATAQLGGGEHQGAWMARLEQEHNNLSSALTFWRCEPDSQLALAAAVWNFWYGHGRWHEGRAWLEEALATSSERTVRRLTALEGAYYFAYVEGDNERARTLLEEKLGLARQLENRAGIAAALHGLALVTAVEADFDRAAALEEESLASCEGDRYSIFPLGGLGYLAFLRNDYEHARTFFERAVVVGRTFRDDHELANDLGSLAIIAAYEGKQPKALTLLQESIALARKIDSLPTLARRALPALATLRSVQGNAEEAVRLISASEALVQKMGSAGGPIFRNLKSRILEAAQTKLDDEQIAAAHEEGQTLTLDEALAGVDEREPTPASSHRSPSRDSDRR